jgi:hypothetical protein
MALDVKDLKERVEKLEEERKLAQEFVRKMLLGNFHQEPTQ